jgi:hypothetical protein
MSRWEGLEGLSKEQQDGVTILIVNAAIQRNNRKLYLFDKEILVVALDGTCTFDDGSEMMLEPEHLRDLKLQVQGRAPTFHAPKPVTTRDTQFAGFARALVGDLFKEGSTWLEREQCEQIIAQRAYDLVAHTLNMVPHLMQVAENAQAVEEVIVFIPDLTELPEVSE